MDDIDLFVKNNIEFIDRIYKSAGSAATVLTFFDLVNHNVYIIDGIFKHANWLSIRFDWAAELHSKYEEEKEQEIEKFERGIRHDEHPKYHILEMSLDSMMFDMLRDMYKKALEKEQIYRVGFVGKLMDVGPLPKNIDPKLNKFFRDFAHLLDLDLEYNH